MCNCSGSVLRGDAQLYKIYAYLAIMRLTELGTEQYRYTSMQSGVGCIPAVMIHANEVLQALQTACECS